MTGRVTGPPVEALQGVCGGRTDSAHSDSTASAGETVGHSAAAGLVTADGRTQEASQTCFAAVKETGYDNIEG